MEHQLKKIDSTDFIVIALDYLYSYDMCDKFVLSYHNLVQCIFTDLLDSAPSNEEDMDDTIAVESAAEQG